MAKKISIKILMLVALILCLDLIYKACLYEKDLADKCPEVLEIRSKQATADILYFGESSNVTYRETDSVKNSISEMANWFFPGLKVGTITKYASHAGVYKSWLPELDPGKGRPMALVVTLNLRSFDASWIHSKLETPLQEAMVLRRPYPVIINRFLLGLQAYDNKTEQERDKDVQKEWKNTKLRFPFPFKYKTVSQWDSGMASGSYLKPDGSWDMDKIALACHYVKGYAFNLDENNPRIKDFDAIAAWCQKNNIPLYLNLMAENVQYADSLVGKELVFLMRENKEYLKKRYSGANCIVIDNLEAVDGRDFIDQTWTTEHYGYKGRMIVAKNLALALKKQFENEYKNAY